MTPSRGVLLRPWNLGQAIVKPWWLTIWRKGSAHWDVVLNADSSTPKLSKW